LRERKRKGSFHRGEVVGVTREGKGPTNQVGGGGKEIGPSKGEGKGKKTEGFFQGTGEKREAFP